jgi:hypothetical protein
MYLENGKFLKRGGAIVCTKQLANNQNLIKFFLPNAFSLIIRAQNLRHRFFFKPLPLRLL